MSMSSWLKKRKIARGFYRLESATAYHAIIEHSRPEGMGVIRNMHGETIVAYDTLREAFESVEYSVAHDHCDYPPKGIPACK